MIPFAVDIFEHMRARCALFHLEFWWVNFEVHLAAPGKLMVVFRFVEIITLNVFKSLCSA